MVPCDHFEWHPPHMSALNGACSGALIENMREPESSDGTNCAPQTPHGCSTSDRRCFNDRLRVGIQTLSKEGFGVNDSSD